MEADRTPEATDRSRDLPDQGEAGGDCPQDAGGVGETSTVWIRCEPGLELCPECGRVRGSAVRITDAGQGDVVVFDGCRICLLEVVKVWRNRDR